MFIRNNKGFTLMELMAVIAIIIILAGFLTPALNRARRQARKAECMNNLKQISIALHSYALDYSANFPPSADLHELTDDQYLTAAVLICPSTHAAYTYITDRNEESNANLPLVHCGADDAHIAPNPVNCLYVDGHVESRTSTADLALE